jgi:hypothetical protein
MDLSNYKIDDASTGGGSKVEPGRHVLHWTGEESELVEGRNNWRGCKMYFEIDGAGITLNHTFTVGHDNPKFVDSGVNSMMLMAKAMGLKEAPADTTKQFMGKSVSAELIKDDNGYLKINEDWGKTWQSTDKKAAPVSEEKIQAGPTEAELRRAEESNDDNVPF